MINIVNTSTLAEIQLSIENNDWQNNFFFFRRNREKDISNTLTSIFTNNDVFTNSLPDISLLRSISFFSLNHIPTYTSVDTPSEHYKIPNNKSENYLSFDLTRGELASFDILYMEQLPPFDMYWLTFSNRLLESINSTITKLIGNLLNRLSITTGLSVSTANVFQYIVFAIPRIAAALYSRESQDTRVGLDIIVGILLVTLQIFYSSVSERALLDFTGILRNIAGYILQNINIKLSPNYFYTFQDCQVIDNYNEGAGRGGDTKINLRLFNSRFKKFIF